MGDLFGGGGRGGNSGGYAVPDPGTPKPSTPLGSPPVVLGPYPDDGARRMPNANSPNAIAAARKKRSELTRRSGRESTRLSNEAGVRAYTNSFLGSVG